METGEVTKQPRKTLYPATSGWGGIVGLFLAGIVCSLRVDKLVGHAITKPNVWKQLQKCLVYNGCIFVGSYLLLEYWITPKVMPSLAESSFFFKLALFAASRALWILPLYGFSLYITRSWLDAMMPDLVQPRVSEKALLQPIKDISDSAVKTLLYGTCVCVAIVLEFIPVVGRIADFLWLSWVYTFLCFDIKWISQNPSTSLAKRVRRYEQRWVFFLGFGLAFTSTCFFFPLLLNCGMYALGYPFFVIVASSHDESIMTTPSGTCLPKVFPIFTPLTKIISSVVSKVLSSFNKKKD
ncbi:etoposide-induced 2.4 mRNA [Pelomyxa schiedti]|nr:etoposide-induced 2.4 mRNA [Pelomyxa schiedti]